VVATTDGAMGPSETFTRYRQIIGLIGELRPLRGKALSHLIPRVPGLSRRPGADRR
jgi:hypothetical protein